jgi:predicted membrane channel-forming protein YqfA (hemolysin III family)
MILEETKSKTERWWKILDISTHLCPIILLIVLATVDINFDVIILVISMFLVHGCIAFITLRWSNKYHDQKWEEWTEEKRKKLLKSLDFGDK